MANYVDFEGSNCVFQAPDNTTPDECGDLPVFRDEKQIISCWRLSDVEITKLIETGVVWLSVMGAGMPPVAISADPMVTIDGREPNVEPYIAPARRKA